MNEAFECGPWRYCSERSHCPHTDVYESVRSSAVHLADLFLADGAYDGEPTSDLLVARFGSTIEVTIPPPKNAVLSPNAAQDPTVRDRHIADISVRGRMGWQRASGYNQRSRAETLMSRWKTVIGPKLKARSFKNQKTEAKIGVRILNRMTELGRPNFERTA